MTISNLVLKLKWRLKNVSNANKYGGSIDFNENTVTSSNTIDGLTITSPHVLKPPISSITKYIANIEKRLEETKRRISVLEKTLSDLKSCWFKDGDIVMSKTYGASIVSAVEIGEGHHSVIDDGRMDKFLVVLATKNGYFKVPLEDIMPYTKAAKVLHERS